MARSSSSLEKKWTRAVLDSIQGGKHDMKTVTEMKQSKEAVAMTSWILEPLRPISATICGTSNDLYNNSNVLRLAAYNFQSYTRTGSLLPRLWMLLPIDFALMVWGEKQEEASMRVSPLFGNHLSLCVGVASPWLHQLIGLT